MVKQADGGFDEHDVMASGVPTIDVDPYSTDILADPYPFHHELREAGPVVRLEPHGVWAARVVVFQSHFEWSKTNMAPIRSSIPTRRFSWCLEPLYIPGQEQSENIILGEAGADTEGQHILRRASDKQRTQRFYLIVSGSVFGILL